MTSFTSRKTTSADAVSGTGFHLSRRVPAGAAALLLSVSALAVSSGTARADCQPDPATGGADAVICNAVGADNSDYSALGGDDTIDIVDGVYAGGIFGAEGDDTITLDGAAADVNLILVERITTPSICSMAR